VITASLNTLADVIQPPTLQSGVGYVHLNGSGTMTGPTIPDGLPVYYEIDVLANHVCAVIVNDEEYLTYIATIGLMHGYGLALNICDPFSKNAAECEKIADTWVANTFDAGAVNAREAARPNDLPYGGGSWSTAPA
jgi:hypothetical protein